MALCYFYGPQMAQWVTEVNSRNKQDSYLVFDLIKEFLQNAGQSQMVIQVKLSTKCGQEFWNVIILILLLLLSVEYLPDSWSY